MNNPALIALREQVRRIPAGADDLHELADRAIEAVAEFEGAMSVAAKPTPVRSLGEFRCTCGLIWHFDQPEVKP